MAGPAQDSAGSARPKRLFSQFEPGRAAAWRGLTGGEIHLAARREIIGVAQLRAAGRDREGKAVRRRPLRRLRHLVSGLACGLGMSFALSGTALAHGGASSAPGEGCQLSVGPYRMNLTGYQPGQGGNQEFCTTLPATGATILVLEYLNEELRELEVDVRIVRAMAELATDPGAATIHHTGPRKYARGQLTLRCDLAEPGQFVAIVTVRNDAGAYTAEIPLVVGSAARREPARASFVDLGSPLGLPLALLGLAALFWVARAPAARRAAQPLAPRRATVRSSLRRRR